MSAEEEKTTINTAQNEQEEEKIDAGESILSWETWEFPPHERSKNWYIGAAIIGIFCIVYAIATANYMFAIIILMFAIILLVDNMRQPNRVHVHLTNLGIVFGNDFYPYEDVKDFSVIYSPPDVKVLYLDFHKTWQPLLSIPLEETDPNIVRDTLIPYAYENLEREDETLTDMVKRVYKL